MKLQISKHIVTTYETLQDDRAQDLPTYSRSHAISCYSSPHIHLLLPHHSRNVHRILFKGRLHCTLAERAEFFTRKAKFRKYIRNIPIIEMIQVLSRGSKYITKSDLQQLLILYTLLNQMRVVKNI